MRFLWSVKAGIYDRARSLPGLKKILIKEKRHLSELLPESAGQLKTIVDLGTGTGSSLDVFPGGVPVVAVDRSIAMLRQAVKRNPDLAAIVADIQTLPFKNSSVPFCTCVGVSEYIPERVSLLAEIHRVLEPSGYLLFTAAPRSFPNVLRLILGHRLTLYPAQPWRNLVEKSGFRLVDGRRSLLQIQLLIKKINKTQ
ncbi:methyltransferase domain-containing protein [bacterium]|nr:methyltransferase domain-containing protein [bacterium]